MDGQSWSLEAIAASYEEALAGHASAEHPVIAAAYQRRSVILEQALCESLLIANEPVEHGGRLYSIGESGSLRVAVLTEEDGG